ncbi:transglycosylase SLT domain-containing protein [Parabacteroides sp. FAFU027]|uniref:transglycosylase SLT domain-containing protein n=1 Tax=Parabacteroides sp. FAFU027 TaxID=2922715 RepID=UPI001FAFC882|nr:transporter substrate-binding domain-containing protein [Parabacteroides sp. FAFU027]
MRKVQTFIFLLIMIVLPIYLVISVQKFRKETTPFKRFYTVSEIKKRGKLRILTLYSSTSYFIYRGQEMGYEYELASGFAESLGVQTEVIVAENTNQLIRLLREGKGDVVAYNMPISKQLKDSISYCGRQFITNQVLVQPTGSKHKPLKDVTELIGKDVYVTGNSRYLQRLIHLNQELGGGIHIHVNNKDSVTSEDLIGMVSNGEIPYTVSDDNIARLNKTYYENIDISLKVSFPQRLSWMVDKQNNSLESALNKWFAENVHSDNYRAIIKRYFEQSKNPSSLIIPKITKGRISAYDLLFRKYAKEIGWDWQLLAAVAFVESKFDPNEVSWAGAKGLMQIMPRTAASVGVYGGKAFDPEVNVKGAVTVFHALNRVFSKVKKRSDRIKFILAAYNSGVSHIVDAQALANKYGKDPLVWEGHVAHYLALKSNPEYYDDPVCKSGYARGTETCNYVTKVMHIFEFYKKKTAGK